MSSRWFITRDGKSRFGPFNQNQLCDLVRFGKLRPTDMVIREDMQRWVFASTIEWLFAPPPQLVVPTPQAININVAVIEPPRLYDIGDISMIDHRPVGGFICSILSVVLGGIGLLICPLVFSLSGLILGIIGLCLCKSNKQTGGIALATIGIIISGFSLLCGIVLILIALFPLDRKF
jgi:hypothetical protein